MVIEDFNRFKKFARSCGTTYLATKVLAKWARDLGIKFSEYHISESKLIETVLSGRCFYTDYQMMQRRSHCDDDNVEDFLSWVLDSQIVEEVKRLYSRSANLRQLQECTNVEFTPGQRIRTNVLLRMLWYSTDAEKGDNIG